MDLRELILPELISAVIGFCGNCFTGIDFAEIDLRDVTAVSDLVCDEEFDAVFHLAAESHVDRSITGPSVFVETNVVGTINLLEACRAAWKGVFENKRFFYKNV